MSTIDPSQPKTPGSLLIDARELARLVDLSERSIWRLNSAGKLPRPLTIGGSKRWRVEEVRRWIEAGCPARLAWEAANRGREVA